MAEGDKRTGDWSILVVDDDPGIHEVTNLTVKRKTWRKRPFSIRSAFSGREARDLLIDPEYIAQLQVVIVDVVMETRFAGLDLCRFIRSELPRSVRIILRTGEPAAAPEERVINDYDVDYYFTKTEATPERLYTALRACLRSSLDIETLLAFSTQLQSFTTAFQTTTSREDLTDLMRRGLDFLEAKHSARIVFVPDVDGTDQLSGAHLPEARAIAKAHEQHLETGKLHRAEPLGFDANWFVLHFTIAMEESPDPPIRGGFVFEMRSTVHGLHSDLLLFLQNWTIAMSGLILQMRLSRVKALQERMQFERIQGLAGMVTGLAHKINTPLGVANTANLNLKDLADELDKTVVRDQIGGLLTDFRATIRLLDRNISRASQLMSSFMQLSVNQLSDERVATDVLEVVRDCVNTIARPDEIKIRITCAEKILPWVGYPNHLTQVLTTLIHNVMRHAYAGQSAGRIDIRLYREERTYRLEVEDYGSGISADAVPHLFEPFAVWRGSSEAGLGLAVTHNIVTSLLSGEVTCASVLGKGTRFVVRMPFEVPIAHFNTAFGIRSGSMWPRFRPPSPG